jgi:hypothetical protein
MTDSTARHRTIAQAAECLRALAEYRTNSAHDFPSGPVSESMAVQFLDLAQKLEESDGAALKVSSADRALLMETLSAVAPLVDHSGTVDVSALDLTELRRCKDGVQGLIELLGGPAG